MSSADFLDEGPAQRSREVQLMLADAEYLPAGSWSVLGHVPRQPPPGAGQ